MAVAARAETLRIATYHAPFTARGPALLIRDLEEKREPVLEAAIATIVAAAPDVLVLTEFDYDLTGLALAALQARLAAAGHPMPQAFARRTNAGRPSGLDLDGDGRQGEPEDAVGYGWFSGEGGMAVLSRLPVEAAEMVDHSALPWGAVSGDDAPFPGLPLASDGHWQLPVRLPDGRALTLLAFHAQTPVFDGPEDRNGRRNAAQLAFWRRLIDGEFGGVEGPFVLIGNANLDPVRGEGRQEAIRALLAHPRLQDPEPSSPGHGTATVDWAEPEPGDLRVSYVLLSRDLAIADAGVVWPDDGAGPDHKLVWVDVTPPR